MQLPREIAAKTPFQPGATRDEIVVHPGWERAGAAMRAALARGEGVAVLGRPGTGKTLLMQDLAQDLRRQGRSVRLFECGRMLDPDCPADIVLVDEAGSATDAALAALREDGRPFVLAALPGFTERLGGRLPALTEVTLAPLAAEDAARFVAARLAANGREPDAMTRDAVLTLARHARGLPRLVNAIAGSAMFLADMEGEARVERRHVEEAAAMRDAALTETASLPVEADALALPPAPPRPAPEPRRPISEPRAPALAPHGPVESRRPAEPRRTSAPRKPVGMPALRSVPGLAWPQRLMRPLGAAAASFLVVAAAIGAADLLFIRSPAAPTGTQGASPAVARPGPVAAAQGTAAQGADAQGADAQRTEAQAAAAQAAPAAMPAGGPPRSLAAAAPVPPTQGASPEPQRATPPKAVPAETATAEAALAEEQPGSPPAPAMPAAEAPAARSPGSVADRSAPAVARAAAPRARRFPPRPVLSDARPPAPEPWPDLPPQDLERPEPAPQELAPRPIPAAAFPRLQLPPAAPQPLPHPGYSGGAAPDTWAARPAPRGRSGYDPVAAVPRPLEPQEAPQGPARTWWAPRDRAPGGGGPQDAFIGTYSGGGGLRTFQSDR